MLNTYDNSCLNSSLRHSQSLEPTNSFVALIRSGPSSGSSFLHDDLAVT